MFIGGDYIDHPSHIRLKCVFNRQAYELLERVDWLMEL